MRPAGRAHSAARDPQRNGHPSLPPPMDDIMKKRAAEAAAAYEATWDSGAGSHHPDFDPDAAAAGSPRATRPTEELYNAIVADDVDAVYAALEAGADPGFEFGGAYRSPEGYTPLMAAAHRGRLAAATALLRAGADPNHVTAGGDAALFWAVDGGVAMVQLFVRHGATLDAVSPKGWTALQYAVAKGKYGATEEKGVYPEVGGKRSGGAGATRAQPVTRARPPPASPPPPRSLRRTCSNTTAPPSTGPARPPWAPARRASHLRPATPASCASAARTKTRSRTRDDDDGGGERRGVAWRLRGRPRR